MSRHDKAFWPPHAFRFGGGGPSGAATNAATNPAAAQAPTPTPPVTSTNSEVVQQQQDIRRQALRKRGFSKTIFAGDTGGWNPANTTPVTPKLSTAPAAKVLGGI